MSACVLIAGEEGEELVGQGLRSGLAVVVCVWLTLLLAAPVLAQNSAEGKAPPKPPPADRDKQQAAPPAESSANAAESKAGPASPNPDAPTSDAPAEGTAAESDSAAEPVKPEPTAGTQPTGPVQPLRDQQGAAGGADAPAPGDTFIPTPAEPLLPGANAILPMPDPATFNSAESRATGGTSTNFAEGWDSVAEPPEPDIKLPSPADIAGPRAGYVPPEINIVVPGIDPVPALPGEDMFQRPGREYLEQRPLPPLDETETEQERIARNVEESLRTIDLTNEVRPAPDTQIQTNAGTVVFRAADAFQYDRQRRIMTFTGNAEIVFNGMLVAADFIEVNDGAATAYAKDYVMLAQADEVLYADEAFINYDTLQLELFWVEGNTGGTRLSDGVVYFEADRAHGTFDNLIMEKVKVTTCDPFCGEVDEVHLSAKKVVYKRDRSIVLHDVHPHIRSHKVGWLPVVAFPLVKQKRRFEQEESDIDQTYGFNNAEGWFAKFAYTYYTHRVEEVQATLKGVAKVEIVQNLGVGVGVRQDFYIPALGITTAQIFVQRDWPEPIATGLLGRKQTNGTRNIDFKLNQELNLSRALRGNLSIDRVDRFEPSTTLNLNGRRVDTWNNRFDLNYSEGDTQATLTGSQTINTSGGVRQTDGTTTPSITTTSTTGSFDLTQQVTDELKFDLRQQYTANKGGGARTGIPADQEGTFETGLEYTGKAGTPLEGYRARLNYREQGIDYDQNNNTTDNNIQINKEMPKLRIDLPRDLFNDGAYFTQFDASFANLVSGRRRDPSSSFAVNLHAGGNDNWEFSRASRLNSRTDLYQSFYDDGNALYAINQGTNYTYDPGKGWRFNINHNLAFRQGVREPPVAGDRRTYNQTLSTGFTVGNRRSWRWNVQSGYNFGFSRWNAITSNLSWDPSRTARLIYNTSYDPDQRIWGVSTVQSSWLSPHIDERGVYNWVLNASVDVETNYWDRWAVTQLRATYFRRYERGWSTEITGGFRQSGQGDKVPDFRDWYATEDFLRSIVKTVAIRKVNCCTTIEGSWNAARHEFAVKFYLNALPQYPGSTNINRFQKRDGTTNAVQDRYLYEPQFLFPTDALRNDILNDMFGIQARF